MAYHVRVRLRSTFGFLLVRPVRAGVFVSVLALALTFATGPTVEGRQGACPSGSNPIACENLQPGNPASEWDISGAGDPDIQGFATDISVDQGQTVSFKIKSTHRLPAGHLSDGLLRRVRRAKGRHADVVGHDRAVPACMLERYDHRADRLRQLGGDGLVGGAVYGRFRDLLREGDARRHRRLQPHFLRRP